MYAFKAQLKLWFTFNLVIKINLQVLLTTSLCYSNWQRGGRRLGRPKNFGPCTCLSGTDNTISEINVEKVVRLKAAIIL